VVVKLQKLWRGLVFGACFKAGVLGFPRRSCRASVVRTAGAPTVPGQDLGNTSFILCAVRCPCCGGRGVPQWGRRHLALLVAVREDSESSQQCPTTGTLALLCRKLWLPRGKVVLKGRGGGIVHLS